MSNVIFQIEDRKTMYEVMQSTYDIVVIDIYADWCQPCKYLMPIIDELARQYSSSNVLFCKLNSETGLKPDIKGLPSIEFWVQSEGKKILFHTVLGADVPDIKNTLSKLLDIPIGKEIAKEPGPKNKTGETRQYATYGKYTQ